MALARKTSNGRPDCLVLYPLDRFVPGQKLMFKHALGGDHFLHSAAEFVAIERGLVRIRPVGPWEPDWVDEHRFKALFPAGTVRVRATSCYLWGQGPEDTWAHCHWFKNVRTPVD